MWRLEDPAARDQDRKAFRKGRFAERIRRTWFQVPTAEIAAAKDLEDMAQRIGDLVGEEPRAVYDRLRWFAALEEEGPQPKEDRLTRPGAPSDARVPRVRRP